MAPGSPAAAKSSSSVNAVDSKPAFGSRFLDAETNVWSQNAWDHVPPPSGQREHITASLSRQRAAPVPDSDKVRYNDKPARHWDEFYKANRDNFFKQRKWLHLEFPDLIAATHANAGPRTVVEFGCGTGSALFPLLESNKNPELSVRAYDYAAHAIKFVQKNPMYAEPPAGASMHAAVYDVSRPGLPEDLEEGSADFVLLVFVLSALHPNEWRDAVRNIHAVLKPGGKVLLRDYGRHDMAQLRFKGGRLLDENFYARGDKTRVYFFELDELALLFTGERAQASNARIDMRETEEDERDRLDYCAVDTPAHESGPATPALVSEPMAPSMSPLLTPSDSRSASPSPPHSPVPASALEPTPMSLTMLLSTALDPKTLAEGVAAFEAAEVNAPVPARRPDSHSPSLELPKEAQPGPRMPGLSMNSKPLDANAPAPAPAKPVLEQSAVEKAVPVPGLTKSADEVDKDISAVENAVEKGNKYAEGMAREYAELMSQSDGTKTAGSAAGKPYPSSTAAMPAAEGGAEEEDFEEPQIHPLLLESNGATAGNGLFKATQLGIDRRLLVNRRRQLKMYRVWMQTQFEKL